MPRRADGRGSAAASQQRTAGGRFVKTGDTHRPDSFEELAFRTIKCLHPSLRFRRADLRMDRIRHLIERVLRGDRPSPQPIVVKAEPTAQKPKSRASRRRPVESNGDPIARSRAKRAAALYASSGGKHRRDKPNGIAETKRPNSTTTDEDESEECKEKTQLELLVERSLAEVSSAASFGVVRRELRRLLPSAPTKSRHSSLDQQILQLLDAEPLRCRIDPQRLAAKNIQCVELQVLIELHKIQLSGRDLDETTVIPKLRYLQVITGDTHLHRFLNRIVEKEFGSALPVQLDTIRGRMCVELASSSQSNASDDLPNGGTDLNGNTKVEPFEAFHSTSAADSPPSLDSTPRKRSNTSPSSVLSSASTFDGSSMEAASVGSSENHSQDRNGNHTELKAQKRKLSVESAHSSLSSVTKRTASSDEEPPQLSGPEDRTNEAEEEEEEESEEAEPPKLTALRRRSSTQSSISRAEQRATKRSEYKASARGSIASRRQTNKRLCVIRQTSSGLIQPTSRRSSTASLLAQQQQQSGASLRKRVLTAGILKSSESRDSTPIPAKKPKVENNISTEAEKKKRRKTEDVLTSAVLKRYRTRMNDIREQAKDASEHEVFYGRCNERQALFEFTEEIPEETKPSKTKQKNRSGRSVKKANSDCLYIAHWLLNVHNADPLAPGRPRVNPSLAANTFYGGYKPKRNDAPFRIKKLLRHANRAKVLELRRYVQRTQLMEKLKREKAAAAGAAVEVA